MKEGLQQLVFACLAQKQDAEQLPGEEVLTVSETISKAASFYETIRNTLEYDEEHLLRRNAIRRILKRRLYEVAPAEVAEDVLHELIWAHYLPNKRIPESMLAVVAQIIEKYLPLLQEARKAKDASFRQQWILDVLSSEIEYRIARPRVDETLAGVAYQHLFSRITWSSGLIPQRDHELQLFIAVHRAILKSNIATLRFRIFSLYYPTWAEAKPQDDLVQEVAGGLTRIIAAVEGQIKHPGTDAAFRMVRRHAIIFHVLKDVACEHPDETMEALRSGELALVEAAIAQAAQARYKRFRVRLRRSVMRAVLFLFLTKMMVGLLVELPYERFIIHETSWLPLLSNIFFHPFLLGVIGLSVRIPAKRNTDRILEEVRAMLAGQALPIVFKTRRSWSVGTLGVLFHVFYAFAFVVTIMLISSLLHSFGFNGLSIFFFLFFLSLVTFFGLKIRNTKRELVLVESDTRGISILIDILFLPLIRAGRWMSLRAPRVNVFLFFFDFIIEAPFKAAIRLIEGWLAFLREKKEEI